MDIQFLPGVGPKRAELLRKELGVGTVGEMLRLYPFRYIDRSSLMRIAEARPDMAYVQFRARVRRVDLFGKGPVSAGGRDTFANGMNGAEENGGNTSDKSVKFNTVKRMSVWVSDGSGEMELVFFKGIKWMHDKLKPGSEWIFFGKPTAFNGRMNLVHPEVDAVPLTGVAATEDPSGSAAVSGGGMTMTGVYQSTERLKNSGVTGKVMNKLMEAALNKALGAVEESLPEYIIRQCGLVPIHFALRNISQRTWSRLRRRNTD